MVQLGLLGFMAGKASIENGKLGGRPKNRKNNKTLEKEEARQLWRQMVFERLTPLFEAQMSLARGTSYLYRIEENAKGGREHVIVTDPDEIGDILSQMDEGLPGVYNDKYYYITTKPPENRAIDSLVDRAMDKPTQHTDHTTLGKELPTPILGGASLQHDLQADDGVEQDTPSK